MTNCNCYNVQCKIPCSAVTSVVGVIAHIIFPKEGDTLTPNNMISMTILMGGEVGGKNGRSRAKRDHNCRGGLSMFVTTVCGSLQGL